MNTLELIALFLSILLIIPEAIESTMNMMPAIKRYIRKFKRKPDAK